MKELIYYPGFEVADKNWLKFALLYFDKLCPIIPNGICNFNKIMSKDFLFVMNETDLIHPYSPSFIEGESASFIACKKFDDILKNPLFSKNKVPYIAKCHNNTILYREKYSSDFEYYCIKNNLASYCDDGIEISEEYAFIYMSILADIISRNREVETITDKSKYLNLPISFIPRANSYKKYNFAQTNIELNLPTNIESIPIPTFVKLRNNQEFNKIRTAYMEEIDRYINDSENQKNKKSAEFLSYKQDFAKFCEQSINMIAATTLTAFSAQETLNEPSAKNIARFLAGMYLDYSFINRSDCSKFITDLKNKHLARRYLSNIKKISV